jgi:zinc and cadmium transporter
MEMLLMIGVIVAGSAVSLLGGSLIFTTKKRREKAILLAMPFGAGALLAAAFFDLLPEAFELGEPRELLLWALGGFLAFFAFERSASWFHRHHDHDEKSHDSQRKLIVFGDMMHNAIDGAAIGAAFVVSPALGIITTIAVSAHEIPKELGTFALLLSRGWKDKTVLLANVATAIATIIAAVIVYSLGSAAQLPLAVLLAVTAGFFIYVAASDIIPDIHEQTHRTGMIQATVLIVSVFAVGALITFLHSGDLHTHNHAIKEIHHLEEHHLEGVHDEH